MEYARLLSGIGLLLLNSCVVSNRLYWSDPDSNAFNRAKSDPLKPYTNVEFAKQGKGFVLPVPPTIVTWDKRKSDYGLTFHISTDTTIYRELKEISFAIYYPDNSILTSGKATVHLPFEKSGEPHALFGKTYQQYSLRYETDFDIKATDKQTDFRIDFILHVKDSAGALKTFIYNDYVLKRSKSK